ncbi:MAG: hypothetical protein OXC07_01285 [Kistimonas sp.]|nr:hypothetical protein [Kistimonas sp.]
MKNAIFPLLLALVPLSSHVQACPETTGDEFFVRKPEALCSSEFGTLEAKGRKVRDDTLATLETEFRTTVIDASIESSRMEVRKRSTTGKPEGSKERLYLRIEEGARAFSRDITPYSGIVFNDAVVVFPRVHDFMSVLNDCDFADEYVKDRVSRIKLGTTHKALSFSEVLSDLGVPLKAVYMDAHLAKFFSRIAIKVDASRNAAFLSGTLHRNLAPAIMLLHQHFPAVKELHLGRVPGTGEFTYVMEASLLVRYLGLDTHADKDSIIFSGGVDLFLAGESQFFHKGAKLVTHGWQAGNYNEESSLTAQSAHKRRLSAHQLLIDRFHETLSYPALAREQSRLLAPDDLHLLTVDELAQMGVIIMEDD